MTSFIICSPH